jgi:hypothetical protein
MLEEWLSKQEFKLDAPVQSLPDTAKSVTHYLGRTQTKTNPTTKQNQNLEAIQTQVSQPKAADQRYDIGREDLHWSPRPLEAKIYALTVGQEAYVSNPTVDIEAGEYMELSDDAKALLQEELDFDIDLPASENGPEPEQYFPYTHDYAIVGVLRSLQQVPQHRDLKTAILSQLISWVTGAIEIYARTRQATDDETEPAVDSELLHAREDELPAWGSNHITASRDGNVVSDLENEQLLFGVYVRDRVRKKSEIQESNDDEDPSVDTPDEPKSTDMSPESSTNQSNQ